MRVKIAHGTFAWDSTERRTNRYGAFYLDSDAYDVPGVSVPTFDHEVSRRLQGQRVRLTAKVVETRDSGHVGDPFLQIVPSRPEVGEEVDLGVGIFEQGSVAWASVPTIILRPDDDRSEFWLDPRKLYRLHDQTIDLYVEETTDDFSTRPDVKNHVNPEELIHIEGTAFQAKTIDGFNPLAPQVENLGGGLLKVRLSPFEPFIKPGRKTRSDMH